MKKGLKRVSALIDVPPIIVGKIDLMKKGLKPEGCSAR